MNDILYLATEDGVTFRQRKGDTYEPCGQGMKGVGITCITATSDCVIAGTGSGIFRSDSGGESWRKSSRGLHLQHLRWLSHDPQNPEKVLAGTEPAGIFLSEDSGRGWSECREVGRFRDEGEWYLPYSPEAGCIRGFAFNGSRAYAAAEVGGLLVSRTGGTSWELVEGSSGTPDMPEKPGQIHPDVHSIHVHPSSPDRLLACCGGGLYRSDDGGTSWTGIYDCYCRAAWWNPEDPAHIIFGPADSVSEYGRIEVTHDGGETWQEASRNLNTPWPETMVERFLTVSDHLLAILSDGAMVESPLEKVGWQRVMEQEAAINAACWASVGS
ncbi:MAG: WD40/YVTN/BNR-like repeat-containing protein [Planctomycetota bacterium]